MCKFLRFSTYTPIDCYTLHYIEESEKCFNKYFKYIQDDFAPKDFYSFIRSYPFFWFILNRDNKYMGFVCLDNFTGSSRNNFSAEITTCLDIKAWGEFSKYCAKLFLKMCFDVFGFYKIKANIFPDNFRVKKILQMSGFVYETTLKSETLRCGKPQDIEVYSLYKTYYDLKNEVNYEN